MLDTSNWPEVELDVLKDVQLDAKNVRLEVTDAKVEADIIEDLFVNEDALGLVEGICKVGYLTHETPVVLKRRGKYVMVEGNRRLAALKAIQNPMLVPDYRARVASLAALLPDRCAREGPSHDRAEPNRSGSVDRGHPHWESPTCVESQQTSSVLPGTDRRWAETRRAPH